MEEATLNDTQLATIDRPRPVGGWPTIKLESRDLEVAVVRKRFNAKKKIAPAPAVLGATMTDDPKPLAKFIAKQHREASDYLTLVIVNRVPRAQKIYELLIKE